MTFFVILIPGLAHGQNLLTNPAFTDGNTGFSSSYIYFTGSPLPEGRYVTAHSPREHHPQQADFGDHTTGTGLMMVVNGGTLSDVYNWPVWEETVNVVQNIRYDFSGWTTTADSLDGSPAKLAVKVNGVSILDPFIVPNHAADWQQFGNPWDSGLATTAQIQIFSTNTSANGNDFVMDDMYFAPAVPEPSSLWGLGTLISGLLISLRGRRPKLVTQE